MQPVLLQRVGHAGELQISLNIEKMCVLCPRRGGQRVHIAWSSLSELLGGKCTGYGGVLKAPQFVFSALAVLARVMTGWWWPPPAPFCLFSGQRAHLGLGAGRHSQQPVCICEILCSSWARRGGRQRGGEWVSPFNSITKQIQDPASWASSILIGISTRTPAPAEHFYRTENKFSNEPEWLNQEIVGRELYIEHTGIQTQIKQPKHVSPALCYLKAKSTFGGSSANCIWFCSEKLGFRALIRFIWQEWRILAPPANVIHCLLQHASSHPHLLLHFLSTFFFFFLPIKTVRPMGLFALCCAGKERSILKISMGSRALQTRALGVYASASEICWIGKDSFFQYHPV